MDQEFANLTTASSTPISIEEIKAAHAKMEAVIAAGRLELLRAANFETMKCPRCLRTPVLTSAGGGDTVEMCAWVYRQVINHPEIKRMRSLDPPGMLGGGRLGFILSQYPCEPGVKNWSTPRGGK